MQKMVFSAIALVAFSFAGMANGKEIEIKEPKKEKKEQVKKVKADCKLIKFQAYTQARIDGFSHEDASGMSYAIYFNCLGW